jgi:hypothetical protein
LKDWHIGGFHQETKETDNQAVRAGVVGRQAVMIDLAGTHGAERKGVYQYLPKEWHIPGICI